MKTNTDKVRAARRMVVELLLANHPKDCLACQKSGDCELQNIAADLGLRKIRFEGGARKAHTIDASNPCLVRDQEKCILCGRYPYSFSLPYLLQQDKHRRLQAYALR